MKTAKKDNDCNCDTKRTDIEQIFRIEFPVCSFMHRGNWKGHGKCVETLNNACLIGNSDHLKSMEEQSKNMLRLLDKLSVKIQENSYVVDNE